MAEGEYSLLPSEEVIYKGPGVVLTTHRLMANFGRSDDGTFDEAPLDEVSSPRKYNRGKFSQTYFGVRLLVGGTAVLGGEVLVESVVGLVEIVSAALFLAGTLSVVGGLYYIIAGLLEVKPHTIMVFPTAEGGEISVAFKDWDSPDAEELRRGFARAKRGF